jgi:hypothetical protein
MATYTAIADCRSPDQAQEAEENGSGIEQHDCQVAYHAADDGDVKRVKDVGDPGDNEEQDSGELVGKRRYSLVEVARHR